MGEKRQSVRILAGGSVPVNPFAVRRNPILFAGEEYILIVLAVDVIY